MIHSENINTKIKTMNNAENTKTLCYVKLGWLGTVSSPNRFKETRLVVHYLIRFTPHSFLKENNRLHLRNGYFILCLKNCCAIHTLLINVWASSCVRHRSGEVECYCEWTGNLRLETWNHQVSYIMNIDVKPSSFYW